MVGFSLGITPLYLCLLHLQSIQIIQPHSYRHTKVETLPALQDSSVEMLISQAIDKKVPVETLERLLAMRKELKAEYAKEQFNIAMATFQADCPIIKKTKPVHTKNGTVAYRYAPIDSIVSQVKQLIREHGFSYSVDTTPFDGRVEVTVCVRHILGHEGRVSVNLPFVERTAMMTNAQVESATISLATRRAFCNAFGIITGDDDTDAGKQDVAVRPISQLLIDELLALINMTNYTESQVVKGWKVSKLEELSYEQGVTLLGKLQGYIEKEEKDGRI